MKFIDLSHSISADLAVFPGDTPVQLRKDKEISKDGYNNFQLNTGMHVGTHVDGPMHLTLDHRYISEMPLDRFSGKGILINVQDIKNITLDQIDVSGILSNQIILFYSGLDKHFGDRDYFLNYPVFGEDLVNYLAGQKVKMIGIDWTSPDKEPYPMHEILLKNDILIMENLTNLDLLLNQEFEIFAFPLKIKADSSLIRAVAGINE